MEKRLILFVLSSVIIFTGYAFLRLAMFPAPAVPPVAERPDGKQAEKPKSPAGDSAAKPAGEPEPGVMPPPSEPGDAQPAVAAQPDDVAEAPPVAEPDRPQQWASLGSLAPNSPYRLLVTLTNRGAAIERVELVERRGTKLRYRDLEMDAGFLGLRMRTEPGGCVVGVVGAGTPAAEAVVVDGTEPAGLQIGDVITGAQLDDSESIPVRSRPELEAILATSRPGQQLILTVKRPASSSAKPLRFQTTLVPPPLALIQPESNQGDPPVASFLLGLYQLGASQVKLGQEELEGLTSLRHTNWQMEQPDADRVVFRQQVVGLQGGAPTRLEIVKSFQIVTTPADDIADHAYPSYDLQMRVEVRNDSPATCELAYALDGPNGLPTEGWWYLNKISPSWGGAGARDVIWRVHDQKHGLRSPAQMLKEVKKDPDHPLRTLLPDQATPTERALDYLGVDTQYFSAVMLGGLGSSPTDTPPTFSCRQAYAVPLGLDLEATGRNMRLLNSTFRLVSEVQQLEPGQTLTQDFRVFLGPKSPDLLAQYELSEIMEYGWFGWIARPLSHVLHFFYAFVRNYGLAIILLTVLVRGAMFPIGRKAARNAQVMQQLAPEIKAIKEKYKNDLEKQSQAQRELWKKHNFNPLGGCWLMFLQLPIFIGLYRCLSVDIALRQAPLIPGLRWCSNLAGPDMFWNWQWLGLEFLTSKNGWLGPYLNVLPIITIVLFLVQQKMFTPPATDDQTRMQQSMMKYMMIFMGVMFFKVPSGLCVYFIASSLWGIGERKFLPPMGTAKPEDPPGPTKDAESEGKGGARARRAERREPKKSWLERIEQWQRKAEQKAKDMEADKSRDPDRGRRKSRRR